MTIDDYETCDLDDGSRCARCLRRAVHGLGAHRPSVGAALARTLSADPQDVPALVLKGFANLILAREELEMPAASAAADAARALATKDGGTADERVLACRL